MKYKCDVENCSFETEDLGKFISHFNISHKDILTSYIINWMKSNGETPIETCKCCGKKIEVDEIKDLKFNNNYSNNSIFRLRLGYCSINCLNKYIEDSIWKYEPCHGMNLQCLYERRKIWIGIPNKGSHLSLETKLKISKAVRLAIDEGRLHPNENSNINALSVLGHRPIGDRTSWINLCKNDLRDRASLDEIKFKSKILQLTKNVGTQIYFNLGEKYKFLDYFFFYKMHKINIEIDGDRYHKISKDLIRDELLYNKYKVLTLRINNIAANNITIEQLKDSIDTLINKGPYWKFCKTENDIYDWKWLVRYGYYKSCKPVITSG